MDVIMTCSICASQVCNHMQNSAINSNFSQKETLYTCDISTIINTLPRTIVQDGKTYEKGTPYKSMRSRNAGNFTYWFYVLQDGSAISERYCNEILD